MTAPAKPDLPLIRTPLFDLHVELGAKMVPFAGYEMPVQYPLGVLKEHLHTREKAGLFDVSHMGQALLAGPGHATTARALEALVPADIVTLKPGQQRYSQLTNDDGGIIDDLMVTRPVSAEEDGRLLLVVNAARKDVDVPHMQSRLPSGVTLTLADDRALLALQGPTAKDVMTKLSDVAGRLAFMSAANGKVGDFDCHISRSGYTGEDGFEISVAANQAADFARLLLAQNGVQPIGLGARDSLRLEAGLCLYGHDIDETTSPIEADLQWSIQKRRRSDGGFPGFERIRDEFGRGPARKRVGIKPEGRAPAREGAEILSMQGERIGIVTSGGFGPSVNAPVAMGYVQSAHATPGTQVNLMVRGKALAASVVPLPFFPHRYARKL
jgi:aminomethyltransferase